MNILIEQIHYMQLQKMWLNLHQRRKNRQAWYEFPLVDPNILTLQMEAYYLDTPIEDYIRSET